MTRIPYTYLIGWSRHDTYYYGVRFANGCSPGDLWKGYFTSSRHVAEFRYLYGEPDVISIRKVFDNVESAQFWEYRTIRRIKVLSLKTWLNRSAGGAKFYSSGCPLTEMHKIKLKRAMTGKRHTAETKEKLRNHVLGKPVSQKRIDGLNAAKTRMTDDVKFAMKQKMSERKTGMKRKPFTAEHKQRIGAANALRAAEKRLALAK